MTSQLTRGWAAAGVLAGVLALPGCGSDPAPATEAATPEETAAAPPAGLSGSWTRVMRARDWREAGQGYPLGTYRFDLDGRGGVRVYFPRTDTVDFSTEFAVKGRRLTIGTVPICPGVTGRFTWRATADVLTLTPVDDHACAARAALFGGTWTRR
jgi:hypothetical protein